MNFSISEIFQSINSDYGLTQISFSIKINDRERTFEDALDDINNMFTEITEHFRQQMLVNDKIRIVFYHNDFSTSIEIPFVSRNKFTAKLLIDTFENTIQSYKNSYTSSNNFKATVQLQKMPVGTGRKCLGVKKKQKPYVKKTKINNNILSKLIVSDIQQYCNKKNSIIQVYNVDNFCMLRAVLIGIKFVHKHEDRYEYAKPFGSTLNNDVQKICKKVNFPSTGCGIPEIKNLEMYLKDYCITIIDSDSPKDSKYIYRGVNNKYYLYLLLTKSHYNVITSMCAYLKRSYFCNFCMSGYDGVDDHSCPNICSCCKSFECIQYDLSFEEKDKLKCNKCNKFAKSQQCIQRHYDLICDKRKICEKCNHFKNRIHVCLDEHYCVKCKEVVDNNHRCYFPTSVKKDPEFNGLIVFDYEAIQEKGIHVPNLIIAEKICISCYENELDKNCKSCEKICVDNNDVFCTWLFSHKNVIAMAHNAKG
jgi:hypothetical protein